MSGIVRWVFINHFLCCMCMEQELAHRRVGDPTNNDSRATTVVDSMASNIGSSIVLAGKLIPDAETVLFKELRFKSKAKKSRSLFHNEQTSKLHPEANSLGVCVYVWK